MTNPLQPYETLDGDPALGIILLCDHASNYLPEEYGTLGLPAGELDRHIGYDIGASALTRALSERLGAPAVLSCFSRLLIDPNRGIDDPTMLMRLSDGTVIPGNHPISAEEIEKRIRNFYVPYHDAVEEMIERCVATGVNPMIFSTHSFTPNWRGVDRKWHAGMLWDADPRLAKFMVEGMRRDPQMIIGDNEPYDGALKNDTMYRHATVRGLAQGLLEVRQDLIEDDAGVDEWAGRLAPLLSEANSLSNMHELMNFGSRTDETAKTG